MKDPGERLECSMTLKKQKKLCFVSFPNFQKATMGPETPTKQSHNTAMVKEWLREEEGEVKSKLQQAFHLITSTSKVNNNNNKNNN